MPNPHLVTFSVVMFVLSHAAWLADDNTDHGSCVDHACAFYVISYLQLFSHKIV